MLDVRLYQPADRAACLAFTDDPGFAQFLDGITCPYFVMEHDGVIVGCGGFRIADKHATLEWGIIGGAWRKMGLGRFLLMYRLREIGKFPGIEHVSVDVPSTIAPFFEKQGFKVAHASARGVQLTKRLIVCA